MNTLDAIHSRRSIRKYTDQPVTPEQVEVLLRAAMAAPSAGNAQPWQFVVVSEPDMLSKVAAMHPYIHMADKAPLGILVCGDTRVEKYPGYWVVDCAAAVQNLLLAAHDLGLGAVWTGICPMPDRQDAFAALFRCPRGVVPHSYIPIGHPAETKGRDDRYQADRVRHNRF